MSYSLMFLVHLSKATSGSRDAYESHGEHAQVSVFSLSCSQSSHPWASHHLTLPPFSLKEVKSDTHESLK